VVSGAVTSETTQLCHQIGNAYRGDLANALLHCLSRRASKLPGSATSAGDEPEDLFAADLKTASV
jgi:hypothetical protein